MRINHRFFIVRYGVVIPISHFAPSAKMSSNFNLEHLCSTEGGLSPATCLADGLTVLSIALVHVDHPEPR